jgi:organic radical activating enzyme
MEKSLTAGNNSRDNFELYRDDLVNPSCYTLYVTYKCNWFCNYCSEDTHNRNDVTIADLKRKVEQLPNGSDVSITGGEPGLLDKEIMLWLLTELKNKGCLININTNGTFFKKHRDVCHMPDSFLYHCSEHLEDDEIWIPEHIDIAKITFQLVVTDDTMDRLSYYVNKYANIKFLVFGADNVIGKGLSRANGFKLCKEFKDRIDPESYIYLMTTNKEVNQIQKLKALR